VFPEIRRRGSKDLLKVCVLSDLEEAPVEEVPPASPQQIYDVPYEGGSGDGGGGVGEGFSGEGQKSPVTWLEPDPRPPAEYELPWEWKKEQIVKTLSGGEQLKVFCSVRPTCCWNSVFLVCTLRGHHAPQTEVL
jgi:hypothetical protein